MEIVTGCLAGWLAGCSVRHLTVRWMLPVSCKHLWGRRCAIRGPPDYSHSPKVKNCQNPDYRKIKGQKHWLILLLLYPFASQAVRWGPFILYLPPNRGTKILLLQCVSNILQSYRVNLTYDSCWDLLLALRDVQMSEWVNDRCHSQINCSILFLPFTCIYDVCAFSWKLTKCEIPICTIMTIDALS